MARHGWDAVSTELKWAVDLDGEAIEEIAEVAIDHFDRTGFVEDGDFAEARGRDGEGREGGLGRGVGGDEVAADAGGADGGILQGGLDDGVWSSAFRRLAARTA